MAFDSSVIASIGDNTPDIAGSQAKAYTLADMVDRNQMSKMDIGERKQGAADTAKVRDILKNSDLSTYEGKLKAGEQITKVSPKMGMDFVKETNVQRGQQTELSQQQYELMAAKNDVIGSAAVGLKTLHDQLQNQGKNPAEINAAMMPQMMQTLKQLEAATLPDGSPVLNAQDRQNYEQSLGKGYNPAVIDSIVARSKQASEVLKTKLAERKEDNVEKRTEVADRQETERERHDREGEHQGQEKIDFQGMKLDRAQFSPNQQDLLAAMADLNVNLPAGLRSQAQIKSTLDGLERAHPNESAVDIAQGIKSGKLKLTAETAGARTAGTQIGKVSLAGNELSTFGDQVLEASAAIPRGSSMTMNGLMQMKDSEFSDPALLRLKTKLQALNSAYDQLAARGGTDKDKRAHIHELFNSKLSDAGIKELVRSVKEEAKGAKDAASLTMGEVSGTQLPGVGGTGAPAGSGGAAAPPPPPGFELVK